MDKVILIGAFHETIELCQESGLEIIGIVDRELGKSYLGIPILGTDEEAAELYLKYHNIPIVLTPDLPRVRKRLFDYYNQIGFSFKTVISPTAKISKTAHIGTGCLIQHGVHVSSSVELGDFVKLNCFANVMHDCKLGAFTTVAPNSVLLGNVSSSDFAYFGANSTILPGKNIGTKAIIGAGAVVTKNVNDNLVVVGSPAVPLKKK